MASELTPLPGDPVALTTKANALASAAEQIQQAINQLRKLADRDDTVSEAVDKVRGKASDVADNITKAHVRYLGTAQALQEYAPKLEAGQQRALRAIAAHSTAQQQVSTAQASLQHQTEQYKQDQANQPAPTTPSTQPPTAFTDTPAGTQATQAVSDANDAVGAAVSEYNAAIAEIDSAAQHAISKISSAISDSGLNDSFWDRLGHEIAHLASEAKAWAQKYLAPILDVIQKVAAAVADIGGYLSMVLNILAVFIPVLAPIAAAVDLIVLAAAAVSFLATAALVVLGDRTLGDLLNTGITLVASALPIKGDAGVLSKAVEKGSTEFEGAAKIATRLTEGRIGKAIDVADKINTPLDKLAKYVGERGADLGSKIGPKYLGRLGEARAADYAAAAEHGSLEHGLSLDQAGNNAIKQWSHGMDEAIREKVGGVAEKSTTALINTAIVSGANNSGAAVDNGLEGVPGFDYFQHRGEMPEIQTLVPNVQFVHSDIHSSLGGLNPLNLVKENIGMQWNVPVAVSHIATGTYSMDEG